MAKTRHGYHTFNMRIDEDLMFFLKQEALNQHCSMTTLVSRFIADYKHRSLRKAKNQQETEQE